MRSIKRSLLVTRKRKTNSALCSKMRMLTIVEALASRNFSESWAKLLISNPVVLELGVDR